MIDRLLMSIIYQMRITICAEINASTTPIFITLLRIRT